jgi:hypothetical protein
METERKVVDRPRLYKKPSMDALYIGIAVFALIIGAAVGFFGGMQYQKSQITVARSGNPGGTNAIGRGRFGGAGRFGGFGTVTAVTSSSITITPPSFGENATPITKTYSISSSTTVTDNGASSTVSAIAVGDTVRIQPSTSDSTAAGTIMISPAPNGNTGSSSSNSTTTPSTSD